MNAEVEIQIASYPHARGEKNTSYRFTGSFLVTLSAVMYELQRRWSKPVWAAPRSWFRAEARCWTRIKWSVQRAAEEETKPGSTYSLLRNPASRPRRHTRDPPADVKHRNLAVKTLSCCSAVTSLLQLVWLMSSLSQLQHQHLLMFGVRYLGLCPIVLSRIVCWI